MAKKAQFLPVDNDIETIEFDDYNETITEMERKTADFADSMRDMGASDEILVKRQVGNGKEPMEHVATFQSDEYSYSQLLEHLRNNYGGGLYRIYLRVNGKNKGNSLVRIAETKKPYDNAPSATGEMGSFMSNVLREIRDMQQQLVDVTRQSQSGGLNRSEFLRELMMYKQIFSNDHQPTAGGNLVSQMRELMGLQSDLLQQLPQAGDKDEGFGDLIEKMTPLIETAMSQKPEKQYRNNPVNEKEREKRHMSMRLNQGVKQLLKGAVKKSDPALYAELVLDQLPENIVRQWLNDSDGLAKISNANPQINDHLPWFIELMEHLKAQLDIPSTVSDQYDLTDSNDSATFEAGTVDKNGGDTVSDESPLQPTADT